MFIYAKSKQCDLGPIYTITNTQRIRIYPGKLMPKKTKLYSRFFILLRIYPGSPVHTSANTERIQICPVMPR